MSSFLSKLTVCSIGITCKTFLNIGYCSSVRVSGLENLVTALESPQREDGRGIITVSNHISTLDDPTVWGMLPLRYFLNSRTTRWVLGASDVMFTSPVLSEFFRQGQVIETFRGQGVFQPAVDLAIEKVNQGDWLHLYGEGKVNQDIREGTPEERAKLLRFKWGVGRIIMEAKKPPIVIPIWLTGFNNLMPEGRPFPNKYFPRPNTDLSITIGKPVSNDDIKSALQSSLRSTSSSQPTDIPHPFDPQRTAQSGQVSERSWMADTIAPSLQEATGKELDQERQVTVFASETDRIRSLVTAVLQRDVEALGKEVLSWQR